MANGETNNYVLGRGELYFARMTNETTYALAGELYFGNTPEFTISLEEEKLDHFSAEAGVREKDASISLEVSRSGSFTTDNINLDNVALFFFGSKESVVDAGGAATEEFNDVQQGYYYQLGITASRPSGARNIVGATTDSNSAGAFKVVENDSNTLGGVEYIEGTDYVMDYRHGRLWIKPGGAIADGTDIIVQYIVKARTYERVLSGSTAVTGALRYITNNARGDNVTYYFPYVTISPNGDYALKAESDWLTIPFNVEILKRTDRAAAYVDDAALF